MFIFTTYLSACLSGPHKPKHGTKEFNAKHYLLDTVNEHWANGKMEFTLDEIQDMVHDAYVNIAGQNSDLVSLKMDFATKERWFVPV